MKMFPMQVWIKNNNHLEKLTQQITKSSVFDNHHIRSSSLSS